jgi:hypothetical protein
MCATCPHPIPCHPIPSQSIPSLGTWQVPAVPTGILEKAKWFVDNVDTHMFIENAGGRGCVWYILKEHNARKLTKISSRELKVAG